MLPSPFPLSGTSTSVVKAAVPSGECDLCCSGSSAWGQLWHRELALGLSLCTDLLRGPDGCLVSCLGFSEVFLFNWLDFFFLSRNSRIFTLNSKGLSLLRSVRRKWLLMLSVMSFWQRAWVADCCLQGDDGSEHLHSHAFLPQQAGGVGRRTPGPCSS